MIDNQLFFFDVIITPYLIKFISYCYPKYPRKRLYLFLIIFSMIFAVHFLVILYYHQPNFYEIFGVDRIFNHADLKRSYTNLMTEYKQGKTTLNNQDQEYMQRLTAQYQILSNNILRNNYDKYEKVYDGNVRQEEILQQTLLSVLAYYLFQTCLVCFLTTHHSIRSCRKWIILIIVILLTIEFKNLVQEDQQTDIVDYFFPYFTIHERNQILRKMTLPMMQFVRFFYQMFYNSPFNQIVQQVSMIQKFHQKICQNLDDTNFPEIQQLSTLIGKIKHSLKLKNDEEEQQEEGKDKKGGWQSLMMNGLFFFIVAKSSGYV